jgi:hypothetical protein
VFGVIADEPFYQIHFITIISLALRPAGTIWIRILINDTIGATPDISTQIYFCYGKTKLLTSLARVGQAVLIRPEPNENDTRTPKEAQLCLVFMKADDPTIYRFLVRLKRGYLPRSCCDRLSRVIEENQQVDILFDCSTGRLRLPKRWALSVPPRLHIPAFVTLFEAWGFSFQGIEISFEKASGFLQPETWR